MLICVWFEKIRQINVVIYRVHTRPGNPGKPGNVLEFCLVLEKILEFFKNKDLSWKIPEKIKFASIFSSFIIIRLVTV